MFNLKQAKILHTDLTLAEDEIKSLKHTLRYGELGQYEWEIYEEMLGIAQQHKKQAEKALLEFYIENVEPKDFADLLCA